jgi:hypothetical protein
MILDFADARTPLFPDGLAAFLCLGFPPNKKTTRQRTKRDFGFWIKIYLLPTLPTLPTLPSPISHLPSPLSPLRINLNASLTK